MTPEEVAFGLKRSLDSEAFPGGPGTEYSMKYFAGADDYNGPYTDPKKDYEGVTVDGQDVVISMSQPFPDMDYWGSFMAMGAVPTGKVSDPPDYGKKPLSNGPYKVESFRPDGGARPWSATTSGTRRPTRAHAVPRQVGLQDERRPEQGRPDLPERRTPTPRPPSPTETGAANYSRLSDELGPRLIQQASQCTSFDLPGV